MEQQTDNQSFYEAFGISSKWMSKNETALNKEFSQCEKISDVALKMIQIQKEESFGKEEY